MNRLPGCRRGSENACLEPRNPCRKYVSFTRFRNRILPDSSRKLLILNMMLCDCELALQLRAKDAGKQIQLTVCGGSEPCMEEENWCLRGRWTRIGRTDRSTKLSAAQSADSASGQATRKLRTMMLKLRTMRRKWKWMRRRPGTVSKP